MGEVRDAETADIALKAALTGHLVLSTRHTNDAPGAIVRLVNMDLEPFVVASALRLVLAQRLIWRLYKRCRRPVEDVGVLVRRFGAARSVLEGREVFNPVGCQAWLQSGYKGRVAIHEA